MCILFSCFLNCKEVLYAFAGGNAVLVHGSFQAAEENLKEAIEVLNHAVASFSQKIQKNG